MPVYERRLSFLPDWFPFQLRRLKKGDWVYRHGEIMEGEVQWKAVVTSPFTVKIHSCFPQVRWTPAQEIERVLSGQEINDKGPDFLLYRVNRPGIRQQITNLVQKLTPR